MGKRKKLLKVTKNDRVVILRKLDLCDTVPLGAFCSKQAKSQVRKFRLQKRES